MDLMLLGLGLLAFLLVANLFLTYLVSSGLAQALNSLKTVTANMQTLSEQMSDMEEQAVENTAETKKMVQGMARGMRQAGMDKPWYSTF